MTGVVNPRLTLNVGLRYDIETGYAERYKPLGRSRS